MDKVSLACNFDDTYSLLIELIRYELFGDFRTLKKELLTDEILGCCYELASKHNVQQLVYLAIKNDPLLMNQNTAQSRILYKKMLSDFAQILFRTKQMERIIEEIHGVFQSNQIDHVFLKGAEMMKLYPFPYQRSCGDIDCLVRERDLELAVEILGKAGYNRISDKNYHDILFNKYGIPIEIHFSICESSFQICLL